MMQYKFYSPVVAVIDYTGNDRLEYAAYFDYDPAEICGEDGEENFDYLSGEDIPQYARDINAAIQRDWEEMKMEEHGFMDSFLWGSLSLLTEGIHLHTVSCPNEEAFRRMREGLRALGVLLEA